MHQRGKKNGPHKADHFLFLAERTGLEPATPGVTGRYSNQLNYRSRNRCCDSDEASLKDISLQHLSALYQP